MNFLLLNIAPGFKVKFQDREEITDSPFYPPVGLLYIGQSLIEEGHHVEVIDFHAEKAPIEKLKKSLPSTDAIGTTVYTHTYNKTAQIARLIKELDPNIPIIIGGPYCTFHPKTALHQIVDADISVKGEGERTIKHIAEALNGSVNFSDIHGISYRDNDKIKNGKPIQIIEDLDTISFPARHLVEKYQYGKVKSTFFYKPRFTCMTTSRGCPYNCRFCARHVLTMKSYRERSVANVVQEIQEINEKYSSVMISDDNFLTNKKHVHKILDSLLETGVDLDFYIQGARVDSADRELYKKMRKVGVKHLYFGIESGNQEVLDFYNKGITLNQVRNAVALSKEMGFYLRGTFIFGAPMETKWHLEQTIKFACSLPLDVAVFIPLSYQYGSDLWYSAVEEGKISKGSEESVVADSRLGLGNFTSDELKEYCLNAFKKYHLRPSYVIREIIQVLKDRNYAFLKSGFDYLF